MTGRVFIPDEDTFPSSADVVVIGGGIVGVAAAFWLSKAGLETVLIEMRDGLSTLTTPASIESFRLQFTEPAMSELAQQSVDVFENFADVVGLPGYDIALHHRGYLFLTDDENMVDRFKTAVETHHALGVTDSEFLDRSEIQSRFPYVSPKAVAATFRQNDGWLSSHEVTQGFAKGSAARFLLRTKVTGITTDAQGVSGVETTRGIIDTGVVVNAAGPFAGEVARMAGVELPLEPVRRQKVFVQPMPQIPSEAPLSIDVTREVYFRPESGGALLGWVDPDEPVAQPAEDVPTDWNFPAVVLDKLTSMFPFWENIISRLSSDQLRTSAGYYVYTPDDQPLIGPTPQLNGFYVNCGYWAGVMLAPAAGKRIADLVTGTLRPEQNPLRTTRYDDGAVVEGDSFLRGRR